jgi:4-hydroxy-tetrahydrodipicolinate synthase
MTNHFLAGVYAAALTPLQQNYAPDYEAIPQLLMFLAKRGCHGALLLGTTGEGPSFDAKERVEIFRAGLEIRQEFPNFRLLAGTGTPSLTETIHLTRAAFDLGYDGVVVLPPYYYHQATVDGLLTWFQKVIQRAVPKDGYLLGYHFPAQSGVPLPLDLLANLKDEFPTQFAGIKDSTGDPQLSQILGENFGPELVVLTGNDGLFSHALENQAAGCITALANLISPDLRKVWDNHQKGKSAPEAQARLNAQRAILSQYTPYAPSLKALIAHLHGFPHWPVRPPLQPLPENQFREAVQALEQAGAITPS